jgi:hypothetical protein
MTKQTLGATLKSTFKTSLKVLAWMLAAIVLVFVKWLIFGNIYSYDIIVLGLFYFHLVLQYFYIKPLKQRVEELENVVFPKEERVGSRAANVLKKQGKLKVMTDNKQHPDWISI